MKKLLYTFLIITTIGCFSELYSQQNRFRNQGMGKGPRAKIEALEKVKLIEELNMNEDASIKFFARRNEHMDKMHAFENEADDILDKLEKALNDSQNDQVLNKLIADFHSVQTKTVDEKGLFIKSLSNILSPKQVAKFIVFDRKFKEEIRDILIKARNKRGN